MSMLGMKHTEEAKEKIRQARLKRKQELGYINSPETRKKFCILFKGRKVSEETRQKMSLAMKGRIPKSIELIKYRNKGRKFSLETRQKISRAGFLHARRGKDHHNWKGGISFEPYPLGWTNTFKEQIRYRDGYKCQICGVHEVECIQKLSVHHKDCNKNNLNSDNLITLCRSCHTKAHNQLRLLSLQER
jgi:5-methylcytosine-specific restriction endonuclease McrA